MIAAIQLIVFIHVVISSFLSPGVNCDNLVPKISIKSIDVDRTRVWGPGLRPDEVVTPIRYFFVQAVDRHGKE